jgi:hypothetical protein
MLQQSAPKYTQATSSRTARPPRSVQSFTAPFELPKLRIPPPAKPIKNGPTNFCLECNEVTKDCSSIGLNVYAYRDGEVVLSFFTQEHERDVPKEIGCHYHRYVHPWMFKNVSTEELKKHAVLFREAAQRVNVYPNNFKDNKANSKSKVCPRCYFLYNEEDF